LFDVQPLELNALAGTVLPMASRTFHHHDVCARRGVTSQSNPVGSDRWNQSRYRRRTGMGVGTTPKETVGTASTDGTAATDGTAETELEGS